MIFISESTVNYVLGASPNIVMILTDDQGYRDVSYNVLAPDLTTPNIDSLAADGTTLEIQQIYTISGYNITIIFLQQAD